MTEHPSSTFYKDEGGKSNHMTAGAVVQLISSKSTSKKQSLPYGSLTLKPKLVYESGNDVEDADEVSVCRDDNYCLIRLCCVDIQGIVHRAGMCKYDRTSCYCKVSHRESESEEGRQKVQGLLSCRLRKVVSTVCELRDQGGDDGASGCAVKEKE